MKIKYTLLIFILYYIILSKQLNNLDILQQQINIQSQKLNTQEKLFEKLEETKNQIEKNKYEIEKIKNRIFKYSNLPSFIIDIEEVVKTHNINITNILWENPYIKLNQDENNIYELTVDINIIGKHNDIFRLIDYLKKSDSIYNLKTININIDDIDIYNPINANLCLSTYTIEQIEVDYE